MIHNIVTGIMLGTAKIIIGARFHRARHVKNVPHGHSPTVILSAILGGLLLAGAAAASEGLDSARQQFLKPSPQAGTVTLWWLNGNITPEGVRSQLQAIRQESGFGGVAPLTLFRMNPATDPPYLSDDYFDRYGLILDTAKDLGMSVVFYDDCDFPSGTAGNRMSELYPEALMKYLVRGVATVQGPDTARISLPKGVVLSVVAKDLATGNRRAVTCEAQREESGRVCWQAPAGRWEVQAFVCATAPERRFVDVLEPEAVRKFISLTYDRFYQRFPRHFGSTIRMTFFDDLAVYHVPDCALWTPGFNQEFKARYGIEPDVYYPALWENIGPQTEAARAQLFGLRNELFAAGYPGQIEAWCASRGIKSSGHPAGAYRPNPLQGPGDGILFYKYQGYPLTDSIHYYQHGIDGFAIPASAAWNFDKPLMVCETYGNYNPPQRNDGAMLYRAAMELYARGINMLLPHGTWWNEKKVAIQPDLSWRNPALGAALPGFNQWAARCESLLRGGRHVADLGVVYPIDDLAARYRFGGMRITNGREPLPGSDYYEIMRLLKGELRRDFTLLHPEVIDDRCTAAGAEFKLNNKTNHESYRALLLPACRTIRLSNLQKIKAFYDGGGKVLATTCLPEKSVEFGQDEEVCRLTRAIFGPGGHGVFVRRPDERTLQAAMAGLGIAWDVAIDTDVQIPRRYRQTAPAAQDTRTNPEAYEGGNRQFTYLHRELDGSQIVYFANSSDLAISSVVTLRGRITPELWDPHTGRIEALPCEYIAAGGQSLTRLRLSLPALHSRFVVGR